MQHEKLFVDYYSILQVHPNCTAKKLEAAYRKLAKAYHPDHAETSDLDKFNDVVEAYKILRNPQLREEYHTLYKASTNFEDVASTVYNEAFVEEKNALTDAEAHEKILLQLYKKRRENAQNAGVLAFYIKEFLGCSDEIFEFYAWYLKAKGFIERAGNNRGRN